MISIVMTTYNGAQYVAEQIDSILNQTYQDFELIICDDCSKDATWEILRGYADKETRIRIYRNEKNLGYLKNFEKAISLAQGDYIAMSDQDDVWTPDHIDVLLNNIEGRALSCGNVTMVNSCLVPLNRTWSEMNQTNTMPADDISKFYSLMFVRGAYQGASMLFTKSLKEKVLPFPQRIVYHDVWISLVACLNGGISYTDRSVAFYRIHGDNVSGSYDRKANRLRSLARICIKGMPVDRIGYITGLKNVMGVNMMT